MKPLRKNNDLRYLTFDQPVTRIEIAAQTGLSTRTLRRRLKEMDFVEPRRFIDPRTHRLILQELGYLVESDE